jgi:hypothetical protein
MKIHLNPNEMILRAGDTNLCQPDHKVNGKLIVTNQRIYFKTLSVEFSTYNKEIIPKEISELLFFNTMWLIPNGLTIRTKNGDEIPFTVNKRSEWARLITKMF